MENTKEENKPLKCVWGNVLNTLTSGTVSVKRPFIFGKKKL